ncbi:MAG: DUF2085 domain-containing protein [Anaerolineae bacterium]
MAAHPFFSRRIAVGLLVALALLAIAAPFSADLKMRALGFGLDPQRPHHSFIFDGEPMPVEARKVGIYGGFALAVAWLAWRAPRAERLARPAGYIVAVMGIVVMGFDGFNAFFYDLGLPHFYAPRLDLRLGTGLLAGLGMAALLWPIWGASAWALPRSAVHWRDFVGPVVLSALVFAALVTGQAWLAPLIALVATLGLVAIVGMLNAIPLLVIGKREATAVTGWDVVDVVALAAWLAVLELLILAGMRYALIGTTPLP